MSPTAHKCTALLGHRPFHRSTRTQWLISPFKRKENSSGLSSPCHQYRLHALPLLSSPWSAAGVLSLLLCSANGRNGNNSEPCATIFPFHSCGPTLRSVPSDPCPIAVDTEPFPTSAFNDQSRKSAVEYSLLQPRSALEEAPQRLTPYASPLFLHTPLHGTVYARPLSDPNSSGEV